MSSKSSWRLLFVDIDSSFSVSTESSEVKGYIVARAPKGTKEPYYYGPGGQEALYAMNGLPTANWPDLYEAEAFIKEYGCYVSAPAGSSTAYPSYYGGAYITSKGLIDFYNVTSKDTVDYTQKCQVGFEENQGYSNTYCNIIINPNGVNASSGDFGYTQGSKPDGTKDNLAIYITGIDATIWAQTQEIGLNYWGDDDSGFKDGTYYYSVNKTDHKIYIEDDNGDAVTDYYCGVWVKAEDGTYSVILGGNSWILAENSSFLTQTYAIASLNDYGIAATSTNTSNNTAAPLLTLTNLLKNVEYYCSAVKSSVWSDVVSYLESSNSINTSSVSVDTSKFLNVEFVVTDTSTGNKTIYTTAETYTSPMNRSEGITWLLNIASSSFGYIMQKSPNETPTNVAISYIGYDKWKYDVAVPVIYGPAINTVNKSIFNNIIINNTDNIFLYMEVSYDSDGTPIMPEKSAVKNKLSLYELKSDDELTQLSKLTSDVGENYETKTLLIFNEYIIQHGEVATESNLADSITTTNSTTLQLDHEFLYVVSKNNFQFESEDSNEYPLAKDINYNTMTFKLTEEVYPGESMSGGEFTGSFDETGKDSYGANIYWPNVLNDSDMTFCEISPENTFDDYLDSHGIYTGVRIVDDKLLYDATGTLVPETYDLKIKGQRYVTHVVEQNIADGTTGGSWRDEFYNVCSQGWTEAYSSEYDDVYIFIEPTGYETFHTEHASLVETHKLAIAISPKLITQSEFNNPDKITVTGRSKQTAQFAGEFEYYDPYTGKSFWMMPIGDVALMCGRIFENKMGGWAPAWYNYNNMGGQLPRAVLSARWAFSDSATKTMDEKGINPIVYNADDGLMVTSSKTTQDPNNLTDWSYLEHVMSFVLLKREIRDNVMRPQIKKPIDDYWMEVRQTQVEALLAERTSGSNRIWTSAVCDIAGVNNATTKAARKFVIYVKVKVTPFSEYVELEFENVAQTTEL